MRLRFGQTVNSLDGPFGELADIVVDPLENTVTHLVVEPHGHHHQARLVPIWLTSTAGDSIVIGLDTNHVRQLQRVSVTEFVRPGTPMDVGDEWDIGTQHVLVMPYWTGEISPMVPGGVQVAFDRVPKGECEIRRLSEVRTLDDRLVGHVEGILVDDDHLTGVIVMTRLTQRHRLVVAPIESVGQVSNDLVKLTIDRRTFRALPAATGLTAPADQPSGANRLAQQAGRHAATVLGHATAVGQRLFRRFPRSRS